MMDEKSLSQLFPNFGSYFFGCVILTGIFLDVSFQKKAFCHVFKSIN